MAEWDVPGYTELKALGSGGFGDVVLARHNVSGTLVAIKYLHGDLLADQEFAEMFRGEATVLASLDDPNVVRLYEYVESPSGAAIVMELINGVSLREILTHQGKTTAEAALVVLQGSLLGLAAAHRHGVVHRDYKPENVLVDGGGASKLTDFGIAARAGDRPVPAGTLAYAAPEQIASAPASPAGDVYAATATFYECLTGHPPFSGESAAALLLQHRSEPVPLEPVPAPLRPLVAAGMAKDPGLRPTDANTFVAALRAAASGAYGQDWEDRGRSHLGEAALLLAALWPSGEPPAVQGTTVERISLFRRIGFRRIGVIKAAIVAGVAIAVVAAGTALAATGSLNRPSASNQPITVQPVSLQPSSPPAVTGVSPPRGITAGGTGATITGTGLGGTTGVSLGGSHSLLPAVTGVSPVGGPPGAGPASPSPAPAWPARPASASAARPRRSPPTPARRSPSPARPAPARWTSPSPPRPAPQPPPPPTTSPTPPARRLQRSPACPRPAGPPRAGPASPSPAPAFPAPPASASAARREGHRRLQHADHRHQPARQGHGGHHRHHPGRHLSRHRRGQLHLHRRPASAASGASDGHRRVPGQRARRGRDQRRHHRHRPFRRHRRQLRRHARNGHRRLQHADHRDQPARHRHGGHHRHHPGRHLSRHRRRPLRLHRRHDEDGGRGERGRR